MAEDNNDDSDKLHEPSENKIRKARQKGDVPVSREAGNFMSIFALTAIFVFLMPVILPRLMRALELPLIHAGQMDIGIDSAGVADMSHIIYAMVWQVSLVLAPLFGTMIVLALFGVALQGVFVVSLERITPKLSKISPLAGLKRLFSKNTLVEFIKNVSKVIIIGAIGVGFTYQAVTGVWALEGFFPERISSFVASYSILILAASVIFLAFIGLADNLWQRHSWTEKQRMTHKELKDEFKEMEGNPEIKAKRTRIRMMKAQQRITNAVPMANVILTNPTHYAVALKYVPGEDLAPVCVAKGSDLMAAQIRKIARDHDIPIIENKPLARTLYECVEVDQMVPVEHWKAVAEIIGFLMDLKAKRRRKPPEGSSFRWDP